MRLSLSAINVSFFLENDKGDVVLDYNVPSYSLNADIAGLLAAAMGLAAKSEILAAENSAKLRAARDATRRAEAAADDNTDAGAAIDKLVDSVFASTFDTLGKARC